MRSLRCPVDLCLLTLTLLSRFILLNQRQPVAFFFFKNVTDANGFSNLTYSGRSPTITLSNPNQPVQGHLALTADPTYVARKFTDADS